MIATVLLQSRPQWVCTKTIMLILLCKNMGFTTGKSKYIKVIISRLESLSILKSQMLREPFRILKMDMPTTQLEN
jgi:hypothetical protein